MEISLEMISENCRQNGMFFRQGGKLVDEMTTDQTHCVLSILELLFIYGQLSLAMHLPEIKSCKNYF